MVKVRELPRIDRQVVVEDAGDLDRIAERSDRPILRAGRRYGVILDDMLYRYDETSDISQGSNDHG